MPLYGNELGPDLTPYDAGLGRVVRLDKAGDFVGREALAQRADSPPARQLAGLEGQSRRVPRHGYAVLWDGEPCGSVTSGAPSPTLGVPIAMAYVRPDVARAAASGEAGRAAPAGHRYQGARRAGQTGAAAVLPPPGLTGPARIPTTRRQRGEAIMSVPEELHYTPEHEWVALSGTSASVGITDHAQRQLGDVVYVSVPAPGTKVTAGEPCGEVESTKSVSDIYSPVDGEVSEVNPEIDDDPGLVNSDPYGAGWLFKVALDGNGDEQPGLLTAAEYAALTEESE